MPPAFPPPPSADPPQHPATQVEWEYAEATLGPAHPLVAVLHSSQTAKEGAVAIGGLQAADLIVMLENAPLAPPLALAIACVAVQIALGLRIAYLAWRRRDICRQLIIDGREQLPLPAVERELRRLGAPGYQAELAQSIDRLADEATHTRSRPLFTPQIYHLCVLRAVAAELREIARLLHSGNVAVRGVAHVESLLTSGESPLYGVQVDLLRDELGRARYFLAGLPLPLHERRFEP